MNTVPFDHDDEIRIDEEIVSVMKSWPRTPYVNGSGQTPWNRMGRAGKLVRFAVDKDADRRFGWDRIVKFAAFPDLPLALRKLTFLDDNHPDDMINFITITSIRLKYKNGPRVPTDIDKIKKKLYKYGATFYHKQGEPVCHYVVVDYELLWDGGLCDHWEGMKDLPNNGGRGRGLCWYKKIPISFLLETGAVVYYSPGHPAFEGVEIMKIEYSPEPGYHLTRIKSPDAI